MSEVHECETGGEDEGGEGSRGGKLMLFSLIFRNYVSENKFKKIQWYTWWCDF